MKIALKRKNYEFLVMPLKHVLSIMGLVNHPGTPKLWAIAHENVHLLGLVGLPISGARSAMPRHRI
jgi:hypothetical protein